MSIETVGSLRWSGNVFQTVGLDTEKQRGPSVHASPSKQPTNCCSTTGDDILVVSVPPEHRAQSDTLAPIHFSSM